MSSVNEYKASTVNAQYSDGVNNSTNRLYTAPNTVKMNALPNSWQGEYVTMLAAGGDVTFFFSFQNAVGPDNTITATDAGAASPQLGWPLLSGQITDVLIPRNPANGGVVYFCRISTAAGGVVYMTSRSGTN